MITTVPELSGDLRAAFLSARWHGDSFAIHFRVCPARKAGRACLKCHQLDLAAHAAEDRLDALLERLP